MEDTINVATSFSTVETSKLPPFAPDLLRTVRSITSKLPIHNFCLLQLLCKHLKNVADHQLENRMSISNLAVMFLPTLNIGRALFHCMIEHYHDIFEGVKKIKTPPPLPQKPRNLSISSSTTTVTTTLPAASDLSPPANTPIRKIFHAKTMSDTDLMKKATTTNSSCPSSPSIKIPPPKPSRSPATYNSTQQQHLPPRPPRTLPVKPRSKSVSSAHRVVHHHNQKQDSREEEEAFWKQSGRVEAIGKQFETLMSSNVTTTSPTSSCVSSSFLRKQ